MDITRWSTPKSDWLYSLQQKMEKLHIANKNSFMTNNRTVTEKYRGTELRCVHQELHVVPTQELPSHIWDYEAGQRLMEFCQENTLLIANTLFQQHKRRLYTWTSPDGQHQNQTDYILCSQRWRSSIQSTKIWPGADCGSGHELLISKFTEIEESGENH